MCSSETERLTSHIATAAAVLKQHSAVFSLTGSTRSSSNNPTSAHGLTLTFALQIRSYYLSFLKDLVSGVVMQRCHSELHSELCSRLNRWSVNSKQHSNSKNSAAVSVILAGCKIMAFFNFLIFWYCQKEMRDIKRHHRYDSCWQLTGLFLKAQIVFITKLKQLRPKWLL